MNDNYFKSKLSLQLKNPTVEREFNERIHSDILKYGKYFTFLLLLCSILDFVFQLTHLEESEALGLKWVSTTFIVSIITINIII